MFKALPGACGNARTTGARSGHLATARWARGTRSSDRPYGYSDGTTTYVRARRASPWAARTAGLAPTPVPDGGRRTAYVPRPSVLALYGAIQTRLVTYLHVAAYETTNMDKTTS